MSRPNFYDLRSQMWAELYPDQLAALQKADADVQAAKKAFIAAEDAFDAALRALPGALDVTIEPWVFYLHKRDGIPMEEARVKFEEMMGRAGG